jgi:site-specific DNA-cytosine methylase
VKTGIVVLSLFDGMSCGMIALERAGIKVKKYYASEIDKYAQIVSVANYPEIIRLGDITKWKEWKIEKPDLIIGGSPCQGFSFAGKRLNFDDPRSALFFVFVDILKHYKPKHFLLENVRMKEAHKKVISDCVGCEPIEINSALVSAQNRRRLYWTNIPNVTQPADKKIFLGDIIEPRGINVIARIERKKIGTLAHKNAYAHCRRLRQKSRCITAGGQNLSNAGSTNIVRKKNYITIPSCVESERLQTVPDNYTAHVSNRQRYKMLGSGWTVTVVAHIFRGLK